MKYLLTALLSGSVALSLVVSDERSLGAQPPSRVLVFSDRHSGNALSIETGIGSADLGRFAFRVPGRGVFIGVERPVVDEADAHHLKVRYRGPIDQVSDALGVPPTRLTGRLEAEVDPLRHQGQAQLRLDTAVDGRDDHFDIETSELDANEALRAARAFEAAALAGDWRSVYSMLASTVRTSTTADGFVASVAAQRSTVGTLTDLQRGGSSDVQFAAGTVPFVTVPYTATYAFANGSRSSRRFEAYFAFEEGSWKLWFTEDR